MVRLVLLPLALALAMILSSCQSVQEKLEDLFDGSESGTGFFQGASLGKGTGITLQPLPVPQSYEKAYSYRTDVADKAASTEITQRQTEIKDYLRRYFTALTVEDLRPRNEEEHRSEIRNAINDHILSSSEIRDVRFLSLQVIER